MERNPADHLAQERLAVHVHGGQVQAGDVQQGGGQVDVQYGSLKESKEDETFVKHTENQQESKLRRESNLTFSVWLALMPGPRTISGTLMSNS